MLLHHTFCRRFIVYCILCLALGFEAAPLKADDAWQRPFDQAQQLAAQGDFEAALRAYRKAAKKAKEPRLEILIGQSRAHNKLGRFADAASFARRALPLAERTTEKIAVHSQLGTALYAAGQGTTKQLTDALASFRAVARLSEGRLVIAQFNIGLMLLSLQRDDEGVVALQDFVSAARGTPLEASGLVDKAVAYIENPRRARLDLIPDFQVRSLSGQDFSDQSLAGKVVVFDFWGTWCGPCVAAIPHLRRLAKRHRRDPFVLLSVSNDAQRSTLERFVAKESMDWPQIHDPERRLMGQTFGVSRYPTYWVVDGEGLVIHRATGWSSHIGRQLDSAVAKALRQLEKAAPESPSAASGQDATPP